MFSKMIKIFAIALLSAILGNCQLLRDEERPTRYVLPYSGLAGGDEPEVAEDKQYYKPNRRAERIPATAYQYEDAEEVYYRPQPQRPKPEAENYRYQAATPSHKDYEEILKNNHLARLRVGHGTKKPPQTTDPTPQSPVEQYLKEVNPTTKTTFQRPANYLRFNAQSTLKQEQSEETPLKPQAYRYVLQPELQQQKSYQQYQFEAQPEVKPTPKQPHFNLVAYQNALIAQQKLLAAASQEETPSKPTYVPQTLKKTKKQKTTPLRQPAAPVQPQFDYFLQRPEASATRYQQPPRNVYTKPENYQLEEPLLYPEQKELEYQTQAPVRSKQRTTRPPRRKPKYQTEQTEEEYQPKEEPVYEYQPAVEASYRPPAPRPAKPVKYEEQEAKDEYLYQPAQETPPRRLEPRPRYLTRQQYQEETKQLPRYQAADLVYQPSAEASVRQGRGPSVSYRQTYPQYQYDRRHQYALRQEEPPTSQTQKMYPSTQYKYTLRQSNILKLTPVRYRPEKRVYEAEEDSSEDYEPQEAGSLVAKTKYSNYVESNSYVKKRGLDYDRRGKKTSYLNGQYFREETKPAVRYQPDLITQSTSNTAFRYDSRQPFLIVVYDE